MLKLDKTRQNPQLKTLAIDIGGTGVKIMVLDARGKPLSERVRMPTPNPATPDAVLALLDQMITKVPAFDRVSIGFPGVIKAGKTLEDLQKENVLAKWETWGAGGRTNGYIETLYRDLSRK